MIRFKNVFLAASLLGLIASVTQAQYLQVFSEAQVAGGVNNPSLDTVAVSGGVAYATTSGDGVNDVGAVVAFDGSTFTTISTVAQWQATGSTNDIFAQQGAGIVGNVLRFMHSLDNAVYEVDLTNGIATEVVSKATLDAAVGLTTNFPAFFETVSDGTIYAIESQSDQLIAISPGNVPSIEINAVDFSSLLGGVSIGGVGVSGTTVYLGSNSSDSLVAWDTVTNVGSTVLTTAQIDAMTDDVDGVVGFGDIFAAPDGLVYFYESDADFLMSFDPADPAGTITSVLTEAQLNAGPADDTLNQLSWWNGNIAWTNGSDGFYAIPEPTTVALALLAACGLAARRR